MSEASPTIRERIEVGVRGHFCLTFLSNLSVNFKLFIQTPVKSSHHDGIVKKEFNPSNEVLLIFIFSIACQRNHQDTLSYGFEKSNFKCAIGCLELLAQCKDS